MSQTMTRTAFDDSSFTHDAMQNVDYLSLEWEQEDIWYTRTYIRHGKDQLKNYPRLENALWRAWKMKELRLPYFPSSLLQWYRTLQRVMLGFNLLLELYRDKDTDTTWLFGPWRRQASSHSSNSRENQRFLASRKTGHTSNRSPFNSSVSRSILLPSSPFSIPGPVKRKVRKEMNPGQFARRDFH